MNTDICIHECYMNTDFGLSILFLDMVTFYTMTHHLNITPAPPKINTTVKSLRRTQRKFCRGRMKSCRELLCTWGTVLWEVGFWGQISTQGNCPDCTNCIYAPNSKIHILDRVVID